jgi:hypothetical protein
MHVGPLNPAPGASGPTLSETKAFLLAGTCLSGIRDPRRPAPTKPFGKSEYVRRRYEFAGARELSDALSRFAHLAGYPPDAFADLAKQKIHRWQLEEFNSHLAWLKPRLAEDAAAVRLRKFFAGQILFGLLDEVRKPGATYPPIVTTVLAQAAEGLFEFGRAQFEELARVADAVVRWLQKRGFRNPVIVETPLGNCVPVGVVARLAQRRGVDIKVVEWGFPRNTSGGRGYSVADAAGAFSGQPLMRGADCVLLLDDALTGSRLLNIAKALRRAIGKDRLAAVALQFDFAPASNVAQFRRRNLDRFDIWAAEHGLPFGNVVFPPLPVFRVDRGPAAFFETALVWGGSDLIAGKRKVNLLFNFIDHYENIVRDLTSGTSKYLPVLKDVLWRRDADGRENYFANGLAESVYADIARWLSVERLFVDIREGARAAFPQDYFGIGVPLEDTQMRLRVDWLNQCIRTYSSRQLDKGLAGSLGRAVSDIHSAGLDAAARSAAPNHAYGHYSVPYNPTVRTLHTTLCDLVVALVPDPTATPSTGE